MPPRPALGRAKPDPCFLHIEIILVRPERFELPTPWFEAKCSIQLSYGRTLQGLTIICGGLLASLAMPPHPALGRAEPAPRFRCGGLLISFAMPPRPAFGQAKPAPYIRCGGLLTSQCPHTPRSDRQSLLLAAPSIGKANGASPS